MNLDSVLPFVNSLLLLAGGGVGVWLWKAERRLRNAQAEAEEAASELTKTDAAAKIKELSLSLLAPLEVKIEALQAENVLLRHEVTELRLKVEQYIKDEAAYQAELHEKDAHIDELRQRLVESKAQREALERRVEHLEDVCKRAGINGEEV